MADTSPLAKPTASVMIRKTLGRLVRPFVQLAQMPNNISKIEKRLRRLELAQTIYLGEHEALTRLRGGQRIYVDTRDVGIASHLMLEGEWEHWVEKVLAQVLKPGMRFVDVGANFGYYTLIAADIVGAAGRVYSFEANPFLFKKLCKSVAVNGADDRVSLFNLAVYDEKSEMDLLFCHEFSGGGHVELPKDRPGSLSQVIRVPGTTLDISLAHVPEVHLMKIDVEGAEPRVLAGAKELIARSRNLSILLEFHVTSEARNSPKNDLHTFESQGFRISIAETSGLTSPLSASECLARLKDGTNYLMLSR
jgi:FkbM family methyltransferase